MLKKSMTSNCKRLSGSDRCLFQLDPGIYTIRNHLSSEASITNLYSVLDSTINTPRRFSQAIRKSLSYIQIVRFCAVDALASFASSANAAVLEGNVNCIALFNHEEIGSVSSSGAESNLIPSLLSRLSPTPETLAKSIARSFLVSCDMGHAIHPNYTSKHEENHAPIINGGVVIKTNAKQRYTTDAISSFILKQLIEKKGGKVQEFEVRNDMSVHSTTSQCTLDKLLQGLWLDDWATLGNYRIEVGRYRIGNALNAFHTRNCWLARRAARHRSLHILLRRFCSVGSEVDCVGMEYGATLGGGSRYLWKCVASGPTSYCRSAYTG